jgi:hypothetical protein
MALDAADPPDTSETPHEQRPCTLNTPPYFKRRRQDVNTDSAPDHPFTTQTNGLSEGTPLHSRPCFSHQVCLPTQLVRPELKIFRHVLKVSPARLLSSLVLAALPRAKNVTCPGSSRSRARRKVQGLS